MYVQYKYKIPATNVKQQLTQKNAQISDLLLDDSFVLLSYKKLVFATTIIAHEESVKTMGQVSYILKLCFYSKMEKMVQTQQLGAQ